MTLAQIEKTREFLLKVDTCKNYQDMKSLEGEVRNYYDKQYTAQLNINGWYKNYNDYIEIDKRALKCFLQSILDAIPNYHEYEYCIQLIDEGKKAIQNDMLRDQYVLHVDDMMQQHTNYFFNLYCSDLKEFYKVYPDKKGQVCNRNEADIKDIIEQIQRYLETVFSNEARETVNKKTKSNATIDFHPIISASATATNTVDISISLEQARQQAEDAGLADNQYKAVMDKLNEIEEISKIKDSKGKRWQKAKDILKWVAEQGITVAGIVLPLLAPMIG